MFLLLLRMINISLLISYGVTFLTTYLLLYSSLRKYFEVVSHKEKLEVDRWIDDNGFNAHKKLFENEGLDKLVRLAKIDAMPQLTVVEEERLKRASTSLKEKLIFAQWLKSLDLHLYYFRLSHEDVTSLEDVYFLDDAKVHKILGKDFAIWTRGRRVLPSTKEALDIFKSDLWLLFIESEQSVDTSKVMWFSGSLLIISASFAGILTLIFKHQLWCVMRSDTSILHVITGRYLDANMCIVNFGWTEPYPVGETLTFTIEFFQRNGFAYPVCDKDNVQIEINFGVRKLSCVVSLGGTAPDEANLGVVKFSIRYAGEYHFNIMVKNVHIPGSPFVKRFVPGAVDPAKTKFERHSSIVICCADVTCTLMIQPRDVFQNLCLNTNVIESSNYVDLDLYKSVVLQRGEERLDVCFQSFNWDKLSSKVSFEMMFLDEGCYQVQVSYRDVVIQNGEFTCVVLNRCEYEQTMRCVKNRSVSFEGKLTRIEGEPAFKPKRLQILDETANGVPSFSVDDGCQPPIYLAALNRNIIAATFTKFLLNNIGGSETFAEKQFFFYYEVRRYHQKHRHEPITVKISRQDILRSSLKATKNFTVREWCSKFEVIFQGEQGVDWGGLRREWFQLCCKTLFNPNNNLFKGFSDSPQALVHPNRHRPSHLKLKYFEFAGKLLGKCLYDSALGGSYSQFVKAKFTRSFLAQLIGLRINHNYFQPDDPELYISKVKYILDSDITSMDLYFIDEEYNGVGNVAKIVDLIPNGNKIKVTNSSKRQYLDSLAQYRLATSVKDEVETFLKGLNEIIPDNLLCIFDENELELLMCGTGEYSISDFRAHHIVNGQFTLSSDFDRILKWFWIAVSNFTTEEMAKLLQFITGSSQLPPGGFKDLIPQIQIMPSLSHGTLPTAHTCFNQLCLPDYEAYEQFEKSLLLAITEGTEGFSLI